eukprot:sb/3466875/
MQQLNWLAEEERVIGIALFPVLMAASSTSTGHALFNTAERSVLCMGIQLASRSITASSSNTGQLLSGVKIPWDPEGTPLQIMTNRTPTNTTGSFFVSILDYSGSSISFIQMIYSRTPVVHKIKHCTNGFWQVNVQPPEEMEKIWTITKTETALFITCNNVEVLMFLFANRAKVICNNKFGGNVVGYIQFSTEYGLQSKLYRAAPECPTLTIHGSTQENWSALSGITITIKCANTDFPTRMVALNCLDDGSWSSDAPNDFLFEKRCLISQLQPPQPRSGDKRDVKNIKTLPCSSAPRLETDVTDQGLPTATLTCLERQNL